MTDSIDTGAGEARELITLPVRVMAQAEPAKWEGCEGWEPLAWALCAEEHGEEACTELIWEGGPVPEPWGDRWLKYEDEAKRLIALVREHVPAAPSQPVEQVPSDADYAFDDLNLRLIEVTEERDHLRAALATQPTASAAGELGRPLGKIAREAFDDYWHEDSKGIETDAWEQCAQAVAAAVRSRIIPPCESCFGTGVDGDVGPDGQAIDIKCGNCDGTGRAALATQSTASNAGEREVLEAEIERRGGLDPYRVRSFRDGWEARAALASKPPAGEQVPAEVLAAIKRAGFTLVKTAHAYHLMKFGDAVAQSTAQPPAGEQKPVGYMNAGHVHELQKKRIPYGYVYPDEATGAHVAVYTAPSAQPVDEREALRGFRRRALEDTAQELAKWEGEHMQHAARFIRAALAQREGGV
jgi:hypothetical protein